MQGVVLLLVLCLAGLMVAIVAVLVQASRRSDERAGYYGREVQRRHREADADAATVEAIVARSGQDALATIVETLDRLAWSGIPLATARPGRSDRTWTLEFRDGTCVDVHAVDDRALRRAAGLARRDALVVSRVLPSEGAVVVQLRTPHHAPLEVALTA